MYSLIKEFSKEECEMHWKNFMLRFKSRNPSFGNSYKRQPNVSHIISAINNGFCEHFHEINVTDHINHRTFIMVPCKHFWYFDYIIEKPDELNEDNIWHIRFVFMRHSLDHKDEGEYFDAIEFFYEFCNPDFLAVLEKISLEIYG